MAPKSLKTNIIFQYALQIAKYAFPLVTLPYLTRVLGPDSYAVRAYVVATMTMLQVLLDFGFNAYGARTIALAKEKLEPIRTCTTAICILRIGLCIVGLFIVIVLTNTIPLLQENSLYTFIAYIGICLQATLPDFVFQGREDMRIITYRFVGSKLVAVILIFVLIHSPEDLLWIPILDTLAAFIAFVWSWSHVIGILKITPIKVRKHTLAKAFSESFIYFLSSASTVVFTSLTTIVIGIYVEDQAQISFWSISVSIISMVQQLYSPITNSLYPRITRTRNFSEHKKFLMLGTPLITGCAFLIILLREPIMFVIGGQEFVAGSYVLAMVCPVLIFSYAAVMLGYPVLAAVGKSKQLTFTSMTSAGFHILGLFLLVVSGNFSIEAVCVLRCATEAVLLITRASFSVRILKQCDKNGQLPQGV